MTTITRIQQYYIPMYGTGANAFSFKILGRERARVHVYRKNLYKVIGWCRRRRMWMSERDQRRGRVEGLVGGLRRGEVRRHKVAAAEVANEYYEGVGGWRRRGRDADGVAGVVGWPPCRINTAPVEYNYARLPPAPPPPPRRSRECRCAPSGIPGRRRRHGASRRPAAGARKQPWRKLSGTAARTDNRARGRTVARTPYTHAHTRTPTNPHSHTNTHTNTYTPAYVIRTRVRTRFFLFFRSFLFYSRSAASPFRPLERARSLSSSRRRLSLFLAHRPQGARRARRTLHRV